MIITEVEHRALSKILSALGIRDSHLGPIFKSLKVDRREWSEDVADAGKCVGQFIYFSPSEKLPLDFSVTHQGVWASHPEAAGGVDFLLFIKSGVPLFLEIGFFGTPVPKVVLAGSSTNFDFKT
ncbi:hypothetical protein [Xanthomonas sp. NCPPB 2632]|uniref:hypothetical protein n=1 Tax=Xanthomonas sp. NCPPB 2632 TaxID=3240912 RepID=UPI00351505BB